jgi:hypothetical protein
MRLRLLALALGIATILSGLLFVHPRPGADGPPYRDFESYYAGGATWRFGGDPYSREIWRTEKTIPKVVATRDELLPFVGPPLGLPLWALISKLPWYLATKIWGTVLDIALVILIAAGLLGGGLRPALTRAFALRALAVTLFALCFGPLMSGVALGQVAVFSCAAVALVPHALRGKRTIGKTFLAALASALQPNIAIVLGARIASARSAIAILGAGAIAICGSALTLGHYGGIAHYTHLLAEHSAAERAIAIQTTVDAVARGLGAPPTGAAAIALGVALLTVALVGVQCFSRRYAPDDRLLLASAALPLLWPFAHEHDFSIVFVTAIALVLRARGPLWYVAVIGALFVGADWLGLAQRPTAIAFEALRTGASAFALVVLAPGTRLSVRTFLPVAIGAFEFGIGTIAAAHPLHVWPDYLPKNFHVPFAFDAAQTWGAEQIATGIADFTPLNALLRGFSLLGCVIVWFAASLAFRTEVAAASSAPATERSSLTPPVLLPTSASHPLPEH